jgi:predicted SAM-dependent methyltransferase
VSKLNVGCGGTRAADEVGIDVVDFGGNIVHDLEVMPWPLPDDSFDEVRAIDVLEHLSRPVEAVNEMIRVARPGGLIVIQVPDARFPQHTWTDPEHKRGFMPGSLDYWVRGTTLCENYGASKHRGGFFLVDLQVDEFNFNLRFTARKLGDG